MNNRKRWTFKADKPRENKMYFQTSVILSIDLEKIAIFLFKSSDSVSEKYDWEDWTSATTLKRFKSCLRWNGQDSMCYDDADEIEEDRWGCQPEFAQNWFIEQAARLFPEIDINNFKK